MQMQGAAAQFNLNHRRGPTFYSMALIVLLTPSLFSLCGSWRKSENYARSNC